MYMDFYNFICMLYPTCIVMLQKSLGFSGEQFIYLPLSLVEAMKGNPLTGDLMLYSLGYFSHAQYHYIHRPQGCRQYVFIYCREGEGWIESGTEIYRLVADQFIVLPPGVPHRYEASREKPWSIYWCHFIGTNAEAYARRFYRPTQACTPDTTPFAHRFGLFEEMYFVLRDELTFDRVHYANICLKHFFATFLFEFPFRGNDVVSEYSECIINRVITYMNNRLDQKITVKEMASFLGYSVAYFHRKFCKVTGYPPLNYFMRMKMRRACSELVTTDLKIVQVASRLGFKDSCYFSRVFTDIVGVSPQKYRKEHRG